MSPSCPVAPKASLSRTTTCATSHDLHPACIDSFSTFLPVFLLLSIYFEAIRKLSLYYLELNIEFWITYFIPSGIFYIWRWNQWLKGTVGSHYSHYLYIWTNELLWWRKPWTIAYPMCFSCLKTTQKTWSMSCSWCLLAFVLVRKNYEWRSCRGKLTTLSILQ